MEWSLSSGAATVIITAMALIWGAILKIFPKKESTAVANGFMKSIEKIMEKQNEIMEKQMITISLMQDKINGSHLKLDLVHKLVTRVPMTETRIDEIWKSTVKN